MTFEQLQYFISVATYESFSEAAAHNNISQSSISKHIASIEKEIGSALFDRSRRRITLTPVGVIFLEYAQKLVSIYEKLQNNIKVCAYENGQVLTVGMHCLAMHYDALPAIVEFKNQYPNLNLRTKHLPNWNIWDTLESHECNFGILYDDGIDLSKYQMLTLAEDHLVFVVPNSHPLASREKVSILELKSYPMAFSRSRTQMFRIADNACYRFGFEPQISVQESFPEPLLSLLSIQGLGMLFLDHALRYYNLENLKVIPLEEEIKVPLVLTRQAKMPMNATEKMFYHFMETYSAIHTDDQHF
ncbi:LysR family transcriptional regulator [Clostridium sp. KNHs216]|jgi:Transcriptional regulator|uniref:LysR family transcriptional regulator n=1 Tax=Eubacteriales TaxID=186802 RepID=UPI00115458FA|nr:LysR family transcriptional regulator [Clostridium sp. KNHs216]MBE6831198.1 LysR family transcriptional regulator [Oscillospiraceae bacterium]TQI67057.1 DNA-binding transcriptional LysR family regulator [Clostridium sp. KNHs216]